MRWEVEKACSGEGRSRQNKKCIEWCVCKAHVKLVTTRGTLLTDVTRSLRGAQAQLKPGAPTGTVEIVLHL